jgi:site-specific DNA recombinase
MTAQTKCKHNWVVFSPAVGLGALMLECTGCHAFGIVSDPIQEEWQEAAQSPSRRYPWLDCSRVTILKGSKRAVLFGRVSTKKQGDNFSLPSQFAAMRQYAERNGFAVMDEIADTYTGNSAVAERPGGGQIYDYLRHKVVDVVVLYTLDRTARDDDAIEYAIFKRDVKRYGAELHFVDTGKVADDLFGGLIEQFKAVGATEERRKIAERMTRGKRQKVSGNDGQPGRWVGCGHVPYGYRKVGMGKAAILEIDEQESAVVTRIFDMYLGRNGYTPASSRYIARILQAEGVSTPGRGRKKTAVGWRASVIRQLLGNRRYMGEFRYGDSVAYLPNLVLVSRNDWQAVQRIKKENRVLAKRNRKYDYLMANGYLRCKCGGAMIAHTTNVKANKGRQLYYYYVCHKRGEDDHLGVCRERSLRAEKVDTLVWEWLRGLLIDEAALEKGLRRMAERREIELSPRRERLVVVEGLAREAEQGVENLSRAVARAKSEIAAKVLEDDLEKLSNQLLKLREEQVVLKNYIAQGELTDDEIAMLKKMAADIRDELQQDDFESKRYLIRRLGLKSQLLRDDTGRWLEIVCGLALRPQLLPVEALSS